MILDEDEYSLNGDMLRTGCKYCLFGCQVKTSSIHQLKHLEPKAWEYALKPVDEGGLGYREVIEFLNNNCKCHIEL